MYRHRPDILSLVFGLLFTTIGVASLIDPNVVIPPTLVLAGIVIAVGFGIVAKLLLGDVHRIAAQRLMATSVSPPSAIGTFDRPPVDAFDDDPIFEHPIDPDRLDAAYQEVFGADDPLRTTAAVETDRPETDPTGG